jgi:bacteriorhodopsin
MATHWVLWLDVALYAFSFLVFAILYLMQVYRASRHESPANDADSDKMSPARIRRDVAGYGAAIAVILGTMCGLYMTSHFGRQSRVENYPSDLSLEQIDTARWIFYALAGGLLASALATAFRHTQHYRYVAVALAMVLGAVTYFISVIPQGKARWVLYGINFLVWLSLGYVLVFHARVRRYNWRFIVVVVVAALTSAVYPVMFALGHAMSERVSHFSETTTYYILDLALFVLTPMLVYFWCSCMRSVNTSVIGQTMQSVTTPGDQ